MLLRIWTASWALLVPTLLYGQVSVSGAAGAPPPPWTPTPQAWNRLSS